MNDNAIIHGPADTGASCQSSASALRTPPHAPRPLYFRRRRVLWALGLERTDLAAGVAAH